MTFLLGTWAIAATLFAVARIAATGMPEAAPIAISIVLVAATLTWHFGRHPVTHGPTCKSCGAGLHLAPAGFCLACGTHAAVAPDDSYERNS